MSAIDDILRSLLQELGTVGQQFGVSLGYPHRPIPRGVAEGVLVGSIIGARVAPVVTWFLGQQELSPTVIGPHRIGDLPAVFINGLPGIPPTPWFAAGTPLLTDALDQATSGTPMMGNAVDLTAYLILNMTDATKAPNLNLDSDRGYGYKTWDHHGNPTINPFYQSGNTAVNLDYV